MNHRLMMNHRHHRRLPFQLLFMLGVVAAVVAAEGAADTPLASITTNANGSLVISTPRENATVYVDGVDVLGEIAMLEAEVSTFQRTQSLRSCFSQIPAMLIPTVGAIDVVAFTIEDTAFLAFAFNYDGSSYRLDSPIYRWNAPHATFERLQTVPTVGAFDVEYFAIKGSHFLVFANRYDGDTNALDSPVLRWNATSQRFEDFLVIPTEEARSFTFFEIGDDSYLALASGPTSFIYMWDATEQAFESIQRISLSSAAAWAAFSINGQHYLAVTQFNFGNDPSIVIFRYEDDFFEQHQEIPLTDSVAPLHFRIGTSDFLAVSRYVSSMNEPQEGTLFKWNQDTHEFDEFQQLRNLGGQRFKFFTIGSRSFLAIANAFDGTTRELSSEIFEWDEGVQLFVTFQQIATKSAFAWAQITISGVPFLAVANGLEDNDLNRHVNSAVYAWNRCSF